MDTKHPSHAVLRRALLGLGTAAAVTAGALAATSGSTVEVLADGERHEVRLSGGTVADAIERAEVELAADDLVEPARDTEVVEDLKVRVTRSISVDIVVDDEAPVTVQAPVTTVSGAVDAADLGTLRAQGAAATPSWHLPVADGDTVVVRRPVEVTVEVDGDEQTIVTLASEVRQVLTLTDVEVGPDDLVRPSPGTPLRGDRTIVIQRVEYVEEVEETELAHEEIRRETGDLDRGTTRVEQEGRDGLERATYEVTYIDGEEVERELLETEVVTEPIDRVVLVGTRSTLPPAPAGVPSLNDPVWNRLAACESNGNWSLVHHATSTITYYGGLQFHPQTWRKVGGQGLPHEASREEQIRRAQLLLAKPWATWGNQWPACSRRLGLS